jgi:hypothetical protein
MSEEVKGTSQIPGDKMLKLTVEIYYPFKPEDYQEWNGPYAGHTQLAKTIEQAAEHDMKTFIEDTDALGQILDAALEYDYNGETNVKMEVVEFVPNVPERGPYADGLVEKVVYQVVDTITYGGETVHHE